MSSFTVQREINVNTIRTTNNALEPAITNAQVSIRGAGALTGAGDTSRTFPADAIAMYTAQQAAIDANS